MIDYATKEKILDAARIEEVVGDFVSLKKRGANYLGLCPFHQDKNPSMSVSSTKGIFKCFSCGKAGNAVTFIMEHEHLTYPEALRYLAKKYNIEIVEKEESAEEIAGRMKFESLQVVSEYAQKFYQNLLWNSDVGRAIGLSYFRERKFTDETIRKFGLGYAASRGNELNVEAIRNGYKREYLVESGLCIERDNGSLADRFFDRVMFPIYSLSGRVIAFGGRTLKSDKSVAKYVNSPETEIYVKSRSLYGMFQAKSAIVKAGKCILVEGYADVISMHQAGIENVVASSGTSLTVEQIRLIKRFTEKITIIYDGDAAGIKAALRGIDLVLEEGLNVKVVLLPPEEDPDSFAKSHSKIEIMEYLEENERDFISFKSDILSKSTGDDPFARSQMITDIIQSISVIPDPIVRNLYVDMISVQFNQKSESVLSKIAELRRKKRRFNEQYRQVRPQVERQDEYQPYLEPVEDFGDVPDGQPAPVTDSLLAISESELCYYLLKYGAYTLHFEEDMTYGAEKGAPVTAAEYIKSALADDDITFTNELYRTIFDEYCRFVETLPADEPAEKQQERVARYFTTHENLALSAAALNFFCQDHPLTVKVYEQSLVPEEQMLGVTVPKSVLLYKLRITEENCMSVAGRIAQAQKDGDSATQRQLVSQLQMLNKVKNAFARELKRL